MFGLLATAGILSFFLLGACAPAAVANTPAPEAATTASESSPPPAAEPVEVMCPDEPGLCLRIRPGDAELTVDGKSVGTVRDLGEPGAAFLRLEPGIYLITLERQGYETWRAEVSVAARSETIEVDLQTAKTQP